MMSTQHVLNLKLGNIKPGQTCWVHFAFVNDLELSEDKPELTFTYPIVLGDRYNAHPEKGAEITNVPGRLAPEDIPYTYTFDFNVIEPREVELKATGDLLWEKNEGSGMTLKAGQVLSENFGIVITHKNAHPFQFVEQGSNPGDCADKKWEEGEFTNFLDETVAMLNLLPDFSDENLVDEGQEYVVILDRSGSMSGDRIKQAKLTLTKFLDNLPTKNGRCRFNILSFGTDHEFMFKESMACTETNIQNAKDEIETFDADMGGTEMLNTFDDLFKQDKLIAEGIQRQVFLLTDGEVSNTQEVIELVKQHKDKNRIFSFGIGEGVSSELVDGVAQFGGASRILKSGEEQDELNKHVLRALKASQSSYYFDLDVGLAMSSENICGRVTSMGTTVFPGEFFEVFVVIRGELPPNGHLGKATLYAKTFSEANENGKRSVIDKKFEFEMHIFEGIDVNSLPIHRVAAKRIISALKLNKENIDWQERDEQMLVVSKASNVLSPVTALIAVDHDAPKSERNGEKSGSSSHGGRIDDGHGRGRRNALICELHCAQYTNDAHGPHADASRGRNHVQLWRYDRNRWLLHGISRWRKQWIQPTPTSGRTTWHEWRKFSESGPSVHYLETNHDDHHDDLSLSTRISRSLCGQVRARAIFEEY